MQKDSKIYIAGYPGLMGLALERQLRGEGFLNLFTPLFEQIDLRDRHAVIAYFAQHRPEYVFLTAAKVGGILDYIDFPVDFMQDNLAIVSNVLYAAHQYKVKKLLYFSSACVYSHESSQPISEKQLGFFGLDAESEYYALPKLAGIRLCQAYQKQYGSNFISCIPVNLYGEHTITTGNGVGIALIRRLCDAVIAQDTIFDVWGSGDQRREFLYVGDAACASIFLMQQYSGFEPLNLGFGRDYSIRELAFMIARIVGFTGEIRFDISKPEGAHQKLLDSSRLFALGFAPKMSLESGILHVATLYKAMCLQKSLEEGKESCKTAFL